MAAAALSIPDAEDLEVAAINPARDLEECNHLLDEHEALTRFYEENGYIFLRNVLNPDSVSQARDEMLAIAARHGLVEPGDPEGRFTGRAEAPIWEESPEFSGISRRLIEHPDNLRVMEKILGEPACAVPIVQYRLYPPDGPTTRVHQDGFYSPGIHAYKPVWITLTPCSRDMGGLAIAIGQNKRGYLHNLAKPSPFPIPVGAIPDDSWATTDYMPGDILIVHPSTPHAGLPNRSDRLRITFDTRVQSAARPSAFAATVKAATPDTITIERDSGAAETYKVDKDTFIRVLDPGIRNSFEEFATVTKPGMRLVVVTEKDERAVMLRAASEG